MAGSRASGEYVQDAGARGTDSRRRTGPLVSIAMAATALLSAWGTVPAPDTAPGGSGEDLGSRAVAGWHDGSAAENSRHGGDPVALSTTGNTHCPDTDLEGAFAASSEMALYLECVIPSVEQWIDATYADMSSPTNYFFVPLGVSGAEGTAEGSCTFDHNSLSYCRLSGNVYLGEAAVWDQYARFGDAAPVVVLAHEVTHHFQNVIQMPPAKTANEQIPYENQADCGAGAFMAYAASQGWMNVEDDIVDLAGSLQAAGEKEGPDRSHGTDLERLEAFDAGYLSGQSLYACVAFVPDFPILT